MPGLVAEGENPEMYQKRKELNEDLGSRFCSAPITGDPGKSRFLSEPLETALVAVLKARA